MKTIIYILAIYIAYAHGKCTNPIHECNREDLSHVLIKIGVSEQELECDENQECNFALETCDPCIPKTNNCQGEFICDAIDKTVVHFGDHQVLCLEPLICNKDFEAPCQPCIKEKCPGEPNWRCQDNKTPVMLPEQTILTCADGYKCNEDFEQNCKPCIKV